MEEAVRCRGKNRNVVINRQALLYTVGRMDESKHAVRWGEMRGTICRASKQRIEKWEEESIKLSRKKQEPRTDVGRSPHDV